MSAYLKPITTRFAILFFLSSVLTFADSWSGRLVDSKCYESEERNVNPTDTLTNVDRDRNSEIRYCLPKSKTKVFALVESSGKMFHLDPAGNAKAADFVRKAGKDNAAAVVITGQRHKRTVQVDSIAASQ